MDLFVIQSDGSLNIEVSSSGSENGDREDQHLRQQAPTWATKHMLADLEVDEEGYRIGRWSRTEHVRFILAIYMFGRDWRKVQDFIETRSASQARSHA